ncbi:MAG: sensor protein [Gemmatimonadetes bacterium]|jgi:PAS domain S-box-containing protein|nr:sensor protein [Gemmatimonadota bacterium]
MPFDPRAGDAPSRDQSPEELERAAAMERAERRERERAAGAPPARGPFSGQARASVAARAFAALAENVRDYAIFLMDPHGVITFWGEGARLIKWWTKDQAEGAHLRLLYPRGGAADGTAEEHLQAAAERGEYTGEGLRVRSDGSTFWAGITLTALWDEAGQLLGFAKVTRDLTARRAADALLQSAAEAAETARTEAELASAAKSGFLATMSHEIRTPINAVMGYLELLDLETDGPLTPGQRRYLARGRASARHLLELISEVLDFSRLEADRMPVAPTSFRVGDAVGGALALVTPSARVRGLELADAVSGYAAGLAGWGDEARVRQILVNLLANAVKFTEPREGQPGRITVSAGTATQASPDAQLSGRGPWVYVRVEDTGAGIAADRLQPIFEPFVQADMTLTRTHGGTGLGLAISRRLARLMGGEITARSEVGAGSTFFLWLPAAPVESLQTGGLEGHGPGARRGGTGEALALERANGRDASIEGPMRGVSEALLADLERVLHAFTARVRRDPAIPSARDVGDAQVEDHLATFLADLAGTFQQLDSRAVNATGSPTRGVLDGSEIQRVVAERHGAQRARLGWSEAELHREFAILREELEAAVRRRAESTMPGPVPEARRREADRALETLALVLGVAEQVSVASFRAAAHDVRQRQDAHA